MFGNLYGTSRKAAEPLLEQGRDVLLEIDWQGARQVRKVMPDCVSIFILPPSREELERRLRTRAADSAVTIARRLAESREEIAHVDDFDYVIVNDEIDSAVAAVSSVIEAEGSRRTRNGTLDARLEELIDGIQRAIVQYSPRK